MRCVISYLRWVARDLLHQHAQRIMEIRFDYYYRIYGIQWERISLRFLFRTLTNLSIQLFFFFLFDILFRFSIRVQSELAKLELEWVTTFICFRLSSVWSYQNVKGLSFVRKLTDGQSAQLMKRMAMISSILHQYIIHIFTSSYLKNGKVKENTYWKNIYRKGFLGSGSIERLRGHGSFLCFMWFQFSLLLTMKSMHFLEKFV